MALTEMATASSSSGQGQAQLEALLNGPAATPSPGILPNFDNPPNLNISIHLSAAICIPLASLAVLIRLYTKCFILRSIGYDDCKCLCNRYLQISII